MAKALYGRVKSQAVRMPGSLGSRFNGVAMTRRPVAYIADAAKDGGNEGIILPQRVYEQIWGQIQTGKLSLATPHEFVITKTNNELEP